MPQRRVAIDGRAGSVHIGIAVVALWLWLLRDRRAREDVERLFLFLDGWSARAMALSNVNQLISIVCMNRSAPSGTERHSRAQRRDCEGVSSPNPRWCPQRRPRPRRRKRQWLP